jgi:hypothetical protein
MVNYMVGNQGISRTAWHLAVREILDMPGMEEKFKASYKLNLEKLSNSTTPVAPSTA